MSGCCAKPKPKPKPKRKRIPSRREIVRRKKRSKERKKERARKRDREFFDMLADKRGVDGILEKIGDALRYYENPEGLDAEVFSLPAKDAHRFFDDDDAIERNLEKWAESMFGATNEVLNEKGWGVDRAEVVREFIGRRRVSSTTGKLLPRKTKLFRVCLHVGPHSQETESSEDESSSSRSS